MKHLWMIALAVFVAGCTSDLTDSTAKSTLERFAHDEFCGHFLKKGKSVTADPNNGGTKCREPHVLSVASLQEKSATEKETTWKVGFSPDAILNCEISMTALFAKNGNDWTLSRVGTESAVTGNGCPTATPWMTDPGFSMRVR